MGYYKIIFGSLENIENANLTTLYQSIKGMIQSNSWHDENGAINQAINRRLKAEYANSDPVILNYKFYDDCVGVIIGVKKEHKGVKLNDSTVSLDPVEGEETEISQIILYTNGILFIESKRQIVRFITKLESIINNGIIPYKPDRLIRRLYENAESIDYLKLAKIGKLPPNPGPSTEDTRELIKDLGRNSDTATFKGSKIQNLKESEIVKVAEIYSEILATSGVLEEEQKFDISLGKRSDNDFYGMSVSKPSEESITDFKRICDKIKRFLDSLSE